jgi:copper(I)-binding protein
MAGSDIVRRRAMHAAGMSGSIERWQLRGFAATAVALAAVSAITLLIFSVFSHEAAPVTLGAFTVTPSLGGSGMSAGYGSVSNAGDKEDRLLEVSLDGADRVELHNIIRKNGAVTMERIQLPLTLAPGGGLRFEPLQRHLMIFARPGKFSLGDTGTLTFVFERAGPIKAPINVGYPASP